MKRSREIFNEANSSRQSNDPPNKKKKILPDKKYDNNKKSDDSNDDEPHIQNLLDIILLGSLNAPNKYNDNFEPDKQLKKTDDLCKNPLCNHKDYNDDDTKIEMPVIKYVNDVNDLIALGKSYHCKKNKEYNGINLRLMCNLVAPLTELKEMVGMNKVKTQIVNQILFFLQGFNRTAKCGNCQDCVFGLPCAKNDEEMLHTVITGPPGVGKTQLGKILGKVYRAMGVLSNDTFKLITRADLIAEYLGQTTIKTQKAINSCKGGVMFIDEVYALGNSEGRDSFAKECIDTLNQNLSEKRDFLCIIAGYKDQVDSCFFKYNEGLRRRFTFKYEIDGYNSDELMSIFELKARKDQWSLSYDKEGLSNDEVIKLREELKTFFSKNYRAFPNYGGDIETLLLQSKIAHSRSLATPEDKKILTMNNVQTGFNMFVSNRKTNEVGKSGNKYDTSGMYETK